MTVETAPAGTGTPPAETPADTPTAPEEAAPATVTGPATDGPTGAVWAALAAAPGATVAAIAMAAGVSKTAARKALTALEADGYVTRTAGGRDGGKRTPDTWHPATPAIPATPGGDTDTGDTGDASHAGDGDTGTAEEAGPASGEPTDHDAAPAEQTREPAETDHDQTAPAPGTGPAPDEAGPKMQEQPTDDEAATAGETESPADQERPPEGMDAAAVAEARTALSGVGEAITAALAALEACDRAATLTAAEAIYSGSGKTRRLMRAAANGRPRSAAGRAKSHPGELRAKVAAHLNTHPGKEFTPHEVGKAIGHSAGAVANALDRLATLGEAVETNERPRRFTAAPKTDATAKDNGEGTGTATGGAPQATTP